MSQAILNPHSLTIFIGSNSSWQKYKKDMELCPLGIKTNNSRGLTFNNESCVRPIDIRGNYSQLLGLKIDEVIIGDTDGLTWYGDYHSRITPCLNGNIQVLPIAIRK